MNIIYFFTLFLHTGKNPNDQVKRIIEKLGTPSEEYLKMASTDWITDFKFSEYLTHTHTHTHIYIHTQVIKSAKLTSLFFGCFQFFII